MEPTQRFMGIGFEQTERRFGARALMVGEFWSKDDRESTFSGVLEALPIDETGCKVWKVHLF